MWFPSFYPRSAHVWNPSYSPLLKGQPFNILGEAEIKKKTHPTWKKEKRIFLCYQHKQKVCLMYAEALTDVVTMWLSLKPMESSNQKWRCRGCPSIILPPKIKWLNERCLLWNQQPIRNKNKPWLVENKNGGRKDRVDLWATIKALKTTCSSRSSKTRLLSVRTYRTDLQEYLASFKGTLCQCCYWSVRSWFLYIYSTVV